MRTGPRRWIARSPILALGLVAACGAAPGDPEATNTTHEAIYGGKADNDGSQNNGVVSLKIGEGTTFELCSGALIAPNVVLTARHCVSVNITNQISCDQNGASLNGDHVGADEVPSGIHVFVGPTPIYTGTPAANGKAIFHPTGNILCNSDMALLVLDRNITSIPPLKVRINSPTTMGEMTRAVGYGQNDQMLPVGTRLRKDNVGILAVGKAVTASSTSLASNEFEVGLSICQGDSGGPAISETSGAVVGVVSRGGNCTDNFGHVYTTLPAFSAVFQAAFASAGGAPVDENGTVPTPTPDAGAGGGADGGNNETPGGGGRPASLHAGAGNNCSMGHGGDGFAAVAFAAIAFVLARRKRQ